METFIGNTVIKKVMNKDGDIVYQVIDMDTEEVLYVDSDFTYAQGFASNHEHKKDIEFMKKIAIWEV